MSPDDPSVECSPKGWTIFARVIHNLGGTC
jgi:hypothetical protein